MDGDLEDSGLPLIIGFRRSNNINCLVVGQVGSDTKLRIVTTRLPLPYDPRQIDLVLRRIRNYRQNMFCPRLRMSEHST